jgi:hypothetical protein
MQRTLAFLVLVSLLPSSVGAQACSDFNYEVPSSGQVLTDSQEHTGAQPSFHNVSATFITTCSYQSRGREGTGVCDTNCYTVTTGDSLDVGTKTSGLYHQTGYTLTQGKAYASGAQATCGGQVVGAVRSCLTAVYLLTGCAVSVSISGSLGGIGGSASYSATPLWDRTLVWQATCEPMSTAGEVPPGSSNCQPDSGPPLNFNPDETFIWESNPVCAWVMKCLGGDDCDTGGGGPAARTAIR